MLSATALYWVGSHCFLIQANDDVVMSSVVPIYILVYSSGSVYGNVIVVGTSCSDVVASQKR